MAHWTEKLRDENNALRDVIKALLDDTRDAATYPFQKEARCPSSGDYSLGYVAAAKDVDLRVNEAKSRALDALMAAGVVID